MPPSELNEELRALIDSLTVGQLKFAASQLHGTALRFNTKEEAESAFVGAGNRREELLQLLRFIEAKTPGTHCTYFPLMSWPAKKQITRMQAAVEDEDSPVSFLVTEEDELFLTLVFKVRAEDWVLSADRKHKTREPRELRHAKVVRLSRRPERMSCVITYDGFSHGIVDSQLTQRDDYNGLLARTTECLHELGVVTGPFPVKAAIKSLVTGGTNRFKIARVRSRVAGGAFSFAAGDRRTAVESVFVPELHKQLPEIEESRLRRAVALAIQNAEADAFLLTWKNEKIQTRVEFWEQGADFLIHWGLESHIYRTLDSIYDAFAVAMSLETPTRKRAWDKFVSMNAGDVLLLSDLISQDGFRQEEANGYLREAMVAGLVEPVYRIKDWERVTETVEWTTHLSKLRREFHTEDDRVIDGGDPHQIIVGFRKVARQADNELWGEEAVDG